MDPELDRRLQQIAESQHGLIERRQAADAGASRSMLRHRTDIGEWERLPGGVLRRTGSPSSDQQAAMASVLAVGPGAALSHASGAALWAFPGYRLLPCHVTIGGVAGRRASIDARVHRTGFLPPHHVTTIDGIPVLTPSRLLFQLAAASSVRRMEMLTEKAWSRRLVSGRSLHGMLDELSRHGRKGLKVMREVLAERPVDYVPPESNLEARVESLLRDHGLPEMRRQVELGGREWLGRVDFVAADLPLVVFVDGERWHSSLLDRAADARQQAELEAAGFVVVRIPEYDVWHSVPAFVDRVRAGYRRARRLAS
ncbi:MAG TPA: type IV toxin-antitoxin system AbiEi family antitoxin domain-containing protein [Acidimicrobiales bacterium]